MSDADVLNAAASLAVPYEGFSPTPYQDAVGVWTIGYGSTRDASGSPVSASTPAISKEDALTWLERDMHAALASVREATQGVPLNPLQEAALADFVYNLGAGNFRSSTLLRKLLARDFEGAAEEFQKWDRAGGRILLGLLRRRVSEESMFLKG